MNYDLGTPATQPSGSITDFLNYDIAHEEEESTIILAPDSTIPSEDVLLPLSHTPPAMLGSQLSSKDASLNCMDVDTILEMKCIEHDTYAFQSALLSPYSPNSSFRQVPRTTTFTCPSILFQYAHYLEHPTVVFTTAAFLTCRDIVRLSMVSGVIRKILKNDPRCKKLLAVQNQCEVRLLSMDDRDCVVAVRLSDSLHNLKVNTAKQFSVHPWEMTFVSSESVHSCEETVADMVGWKEYSDIRVVRNWGCNPSCEACLAIHEKSLTRSSSSNLSVL
jgi:hypothetical protein